VTLDDPHADLPMALAAVLHGRAKSEFGQRPAAALAIQRPSCRSCTRLFRGN